MTPKEKESKEITLLCVGCVREAHTPHYILLSLPTTTCWARTDMLYLWTNIEMGLVSALLLPSAGQGGRGCDGVWI
jgi:hypothetical protein